MVGNECMLHGLEIIKMVGNDCPSAWEAKNVHFKSVSGAGGHELE